MIVETETTEHPYREYRAGGEKRVDRGGIGVRIVREETMCPVCARAFHDAELERIERARIASADAPGGRTFTLGDVARIA